MTSRVYNRTRGQGGEKWVGEFGGTACRTPKEAAKGADFVFACVGNDDDLRAVTIGETAFHGMKKARSSSTTPPLPPMSRANWPRRADKRLRLSSTPRFRAARRARKTACSPSCAAATG
jgi:hypothetical protein